MGPHCHILVMVGVVTLSLFRFLEVAKWSPRASKALRCLVPNRMPKKPSLTVDSSYYYDDYEIEEEEYDEQDLNWDQPAEQELGACPDLLPDYIEGVAPLDEGDASTPPSSVASMQSTPLAGTGYVTVPGRIFVSLFAV